MNPCARFDSGSPLRDRIIKVYVLQAKLDGETIAELYSIIENRASTSEADTLPLQLCGNASDADVIVSNVHMRKRLERHIDWNIASQKVIVTPKWLYDSIEQKHVLPCGDYAAMGELAGKTAKICSDCNLSLCQCTKPSTIPVSTSTTRTHLTGGPAELVTNAKVLSNFTARYACLRASPLVCPNQALAAELDVLRLHRDLEGKAINALGYERAIATVKSYPRVITPHNFENEVIHLPYIGEKIQSKIREYLKSGLIDECRTIRASERFQSLKAFTTIHGVGATTARNLYSVGLRTIHDMERYYDVPVTNNGIPKLEEDTVAFTPNGQRILKDRRMPDIDIKAALALRSELDALIPRDEVQEIHTVVMEVLEEIQPGCVSTIVGGYRRGKTQSNDADIVISHSDLRSGGDLVKGLGKKLVQRLYDRGLVTHVTHLSGFHEHNALRTSHWDSLEKALTVFILPSNGKGQRLHRRLDLIFASPEAYWTAVVGWTGSKMFERDLRLWAKREKGMKFDSSGITRRHDSKPYAPRSELEVFSLLGLQWIDPTLRNADI